jgi:hypothetical protein
MASQTGNPFPEQYPMPPQQNARDKIRLISHHSKEAENNIVAHYVNIMHDMQ